MSKTAAHNHLISHGIYKEHCDNHHKIVRAVESFASQESDRRLEEYRTKLKKAVRDFKFQTPLSIRNEVLVLIDSLKP